MAKYMLIMRADDDSYAKFENIDFNEILEAMGKFNDELIRAGVLLAAEGLDDAKDGVVVDFTGETPVVTDGPYGETKELFGGYLHPGCRLEAGSHRMGQAGAHDGRHQDRNPPRHQHRRVPAGQRMDPKGTRMARADRPALRFAPVCPGSNTRA